MASNLTAPVDSTVRTSSDSSRRGGYSHGRGGAGNIGPTSIDLHEEDLATPVLKGDIYTTGRGGSGNMANNTDAEEARRAQDVVGLPPREAEDGKVHVGRGGAANVYRSSQEDGSERLVPAKQKSTSEKGLAEKGKEWLMSKVGKA